MKKNKFNKKKIVIASLIGVALVSVGTVGFATWIVGVQKTSESNSLTLGVDAVENDTLYIHPAKLNNDGKVVIAENSEYTKTFNGTDKFDILSAKVDSNATDSVTVNKDALKFSFSEVKIDVGSNVTASDYSLEISFTPDNSKNAATTTANDALGRTGTSYTYLSSYLAEVTTSSESTTYSAKEKLVYALSSTTDFTSSTDSSTGVTTYTLASKTFSLLWGSLFGNSNEAKDSLTSPYTTPVAYYNSVTNGDTCKTNGSIDISKVYAAQNLATSELKTMSTALTDSSSSWTIKLEVVKNSSNN